MRKSLRDSVKDIIHKVGVTSILVTHDQEEAFDIADKVVIFNRCASCGTLNFSVCDWENVLRVKSVFSVARNLLTSCCG